MFLLYFSLADRATLANVRKKWFPELNHYCPRTPVVLVGTKVDLRDHGEDAETVSYLEGQSMAEEFRVLSEFLISFTWLF